MCKITPILNGKDNLCWISEELNKTKHNNPKTECVRIYMVGRNSQIKDTIAAIKKSVDPPLHEQVQKFAACLIDSLDEKYYSSSVK